MNKCCICGREMHTRVLWACAECYRAHKLPNSVEDWPAWARSELERERRRRSFRPHFGVSGGQLNYAPYRRERENRTYRRTNGVRRDGAARGPAMRIDADNLLYSSGDGDSIVGYTRILEEMPSDLRERLLQRAELQVIVTDAIRSLPLISQRTIRGHLNGYSTATMAASEGVSEATLDWLLSEAKRHLADLLTEKMGADDGTRFG
jgi:DNA-directed RNA polymerase specialized sigma24 family protein